ncbi:uncharacterized protein LOC114315911 [Camellia sinensis]|uniref:uncharacterized protein LOC114315911 n=1 Tax=Camellia sinensis TaxID=4442 RepID=UPI001036D5A5|nr:uncharacterized protein LOC114315911 [Camellia sinensis]
MTRSPDLRRQDRWREYHKDHGHDIDNCFSLKDHLEEMVQDDRLMQYVQKSNSTNTVALWQESPPLGVIHMMYSLLALPEVHTIQLLSSTHGPITPTKRPHNTRQISFDDTDLVGVVHPHTNPLVIELRVNRFTVEHVLIDQGSTSEIMYYQTFVKLGFTDSDLSTADYLLFGFNANPEYPLGKITLPVRAGTRSVDIEFLVVKLPSPYNLIMDRTWLHAMQAVPSTYHQLLHFPTEYGIKQIRGSQKSGQACYLLPTKKPRELEVHSIEVPDCESLKDIGRIPSDKATEALHWVDSEGNPAKFFMIGASLDNVKKQESVTFLLGNIDVFAWSPYEMPGVDPSVAQHS